MIAEIPFLPLAMARSGGRFLKSDRSALFAALLIAAIAIPCFLAPLVAPHDPIAQGEIVTEKNLPPSPEHPLGTDAVSRDVLSRLLYGGRLSLTVAAIATLVSVTLGTAYGATAGFLEGPVASVMERMLDALLSIPRLLLLIAIFVAWPDASYAGLAIAIGMTGWYGLARLVRGQVLALKTQDFVVSARALGADRMRILTRHILPNVVTQIVVAATLGIGHVIILEAGLAFLGVGLRIPNPSWGNMIRDGWSEQIGGNWWLSFFPGLAIVLTVIAFNVLGDALVRALSPRQARTG